MSGIGSSSSAMKPADYIAPKPESVVFQQQEQKITSPTPAEILNKDLQASTNQTRSMPSSAGFNPSGVTFTQPARQISAKEAAQVVTSAYSTEIKGVQESIKEGAKQTAISTFGETGAAAIAGAAYLARGRFSGSRDIAGVSATAEFDVKNKSISLGASKKMGETDFSANLQARSGAGTSATVQASTNLGDGYSLSASINGGDGKSSANLGIRKSF